MLRRAVSSLPLAAGNAGKAPEWVQVMPAGSFAGRSGIGPFQMSDPQSVIAATLAAASGADLPIDYDHQILWSRDNGRPAPAAGWFKEFAVRDDGIWARVEWTPTAEACIAAREYRYLSPVFWFDVDGRVLRIEHAALTNTPELEMQALASRLHNPNGGSMTLEQVIAALAAAYGLKPDTTAEGIVTCAKGEAKSLAAMAKRLGLPETAMAYEADKALADVLAAVEETAKAMGMTDPVKPAQLAACAKDFLAKRMREETASPDPSKWAPVSELQAVASRLAALEGSQAQARAVDAVDAAMQAGKVTPGNKDWAMAYASKDLAGFEAFAAAAPVIVKPGPEGPHGQPPAADGQLDEAALAVCSQMGISADDYKRNIKEVG